MDHLKPMLSESRGFVLMRKNHGENSPYLVYMAFNTQKLDVGEQINRGQIATLMDEGFFVTMIDGKAIPE